MGNLFRGLATGLLAASVLAITACETRPLQLIIPDFDVANVDGVEIWRVESTGQVTPAGSLAFVGIQAIAANGENMEVLEYQMVYPGGGVMASFHTELIRDAVDPDSVRAVFQFDPQAQPGWYRVSTYNAAGSSPLSVEQKYLM